MIFCIDNQVDDPTATKLPEKETDERNSSILKSYEINKIR